MRRADQHRYKTLEKDKDKKGDFVVFVNTVC